MPRYDYHCPANGKTIEVKHCMSKTVATWGDVATLAGIEAGETPTSSPVQRLLNPINIVGQSSAPMQPCGGACACARQQA